MTRWLGLLLLSRVVSSCVQGSIFSTWATDLYDYTKVGTGILQLTDDRCLLKGPKCVFLASPSRSAGLRPMGHESHPLPCGIYLMLYGDSPPIECIYALF